MKILNVNHILEPVNGGGTAERTIQVSRCLSDAGVRCSVLTTDIGITKVHLDKRLNGIDVIAVKCLSRRYYVPLASPRMIENIVSHVDIVHLMGHWTLLNAMVYAAANRLRKPYVICPAGALYIYGRSRRLKAFYNRIIGDRLVGNANGYVAITKKEIAQFQLYGVRPESVTVIPNGIDHENFQWKDDSGFRDKYGLGEKPFILYVGRLNHIKGPDMLLHAFISLATSMPQYQLVYAGPDGGMLSFLKHAVEASSLGDRVHFIGFIEGIVKSWAYNAAELLVIPSRQEAMSIVALEAGICAIPVLLTDQCGFDEVSTVGGGKVVPASVEGLKSGLVELLGNRAGLREMGKHLQTYVSKHLTWDSAANRYLQLYREILKMNS